MALKKGDLHNFLMLKKAMRDGNLALIESRIAATGEYVALVCAMSAVEGSSEIMPVPLAQMITGNPFEDYVDPTMDKLPKAKKRA